jgi:hypothetical protein
MGAEERQMFKVTIRDPEAYRALDPRVVAEYLHAKGWKQVEMIGDKGTVWVLSPAPGREYEILLPARKDLADYVHRMADAVHTLEAAEERSQLAIWLDLADADAREMFLRSLGVDPLGWGPRAGNQVGGPDQGQTTGNA